MRDWLPILVLGALVVAVWRLANRKPDSYVFGDITAAPTIAAIMEDGGGEDRWVASLGMSTGRVTGGGASVGSRGDYKLP